MSSPIPEARVLRVLALLMLMAAPAHAEGNRLLPFWGQPYPYGFAGNAAGPLPRPEPSCRRNVRAWRRHGEFHCEVVRHARD